MGYRRVEIDKQVWDVWDVRPESHAGSLGKELENGWLCFQCGQSRRRLFPIPTLWQERKVEELIALFEQARLVPTTPAQLHRPARGLPIRLARGENAAD